MFSNTYLVCSAIVVILLLTIVNDIFGIEVMTGFMFPKDGIINDYLRRKLIICKYMDLREIVLGPGQGYDDYDENIPIVSLSLCVASTLGSIVLLLFDILTLQIALKAVYTHNMEGVHFFKATFLGAYGLSVLTVVSGILVVRGYIRIRHLKSLRLLINFAMPNNTNVKSLLKISDRDLLYKIVHISNLNQNGFKLFEKFFKQNADLIEQVKSSISVMKRTDIEGLVKNSDTLNVKLNNIYHQLYDEINKCLHIASDAERKNKTTQIEKSQKAARQIGDELAKQINTKSLQSNLIQRKEN